MGVISVLYVLIGLALRRSSSISNTNSSASHHSPHHLCNQAKTNSIQRTNNSIVLDNNSSPTATLIYNDNKSVTFCTTEKERKSSVLNSNEQLNLRNEQQNQYAKDKEINRNLNLPSTLKSIKQFNNNNSLRPSLDEQESIELNNNNHQTNNQLNHHHHPSKPSTPLFLNVSNDLIAHRPSDTTTTTLLSNSAIASTITPNSPVPAPTTAITISTGNAIHHHRNSQATSRRSVVKMLGKLHFLYITFRFLCMCIKHPVFVA